MERLRNKKESVLWLAFFILAAEAAGFLGVFFMGSIDTWYATLIRPSFSPPNWLFGPAWTLLYALMGTAAYLVWREGKRGARALRVYWMQLGVNALWTPLFFGLHMPALAFADILVLLILILLSMRAFARVNRTAALLLLPYLGWVSFASILNLSIWMLNR